MVTHPSQSNIIVLDPEGKIIFSQAGTMPVTAFPFDRLVK